MPINLKDLPASLQKQAMRKLNENEGKKAGAGERILRSAQNDNGGRKNKLNAEKCGKYASRKEARRAWELKMLERAGKISNLQEQVKFVLVPALYEETPRIGKRGKPITPKRKCLQRELAYWADFVYTDNATGEKVVEDAKGYRNPAAATYRLFVHKKKLMRNIYGIEVVEV